MMGGEGEKQAGLVGRNQACEQQVAACLTSWLFIPNRFFMIILFISLCSDFIELDFLKHNCLCFFFLVCPFTFPAFYSGLLRRGDRLWGKRLTKNRSILPLLGLRSALMTKNGKGKLLPPLPSSAQTREPRGQVLPLFGSKVMDQMR